jgi:methionyl-tRNA synthetase
VTRGLEDFSISRLKTKMPWGVSVPNDPEHIMYVWFDALVNYIDVIGWPFDLEKFNKWWPVTQYAGKDNLRQQSAMWTAMLMSVGLRPSRQIVINGFILGERGIKMSKSLGNVVNPSNIIEEYGTDALRFYLARHIHPFEDSEFSMEKFKTAYNSDLANGLGNLISRVMKLSETYEVKTVHFEYKIEPHVKKAFDDFNIKDVMDFIWQKIQYSDRKINEEKPFSVIKTDVVMGKAMIQNLVQKLREIAIMLQPIMPGTSEKIIIAIKENKMPKHSLFPRKD